MIIVHFTATLSITTMRPSAAADEETEDERSGCMVVVLLVANTD